MKAAIIGASGYTGQILLRLLENHPKIKTVIPVSSTKAGTPVTDTDSAIGKPMKKTAETDFRYVSVNAAAEMKPEVVFAALPHLKSAEVCAPFFNDSVVIDLSADFRIKDRNIFKEAYGQDPPRPDLLDQAVFGLVEVYKKEIKKASLIANPGCYPTCTTLPLYPVLKKFRHTGPIVVNALSGISGAGKNLKENLMYCQRDENCGAYNPGKLHRHTQEIEQELNKARPGTDIFFTPHLVPLKRGMAVTSFVSFKKELTDDMIESTLSRFYKNSPFINIVGSGRIPETADVLGSNRCDIGWRIFGKQVIFMSVIDNLMKGASGQAVQNMNVRFGFRETAGLNLFGEL